MGDEALKAKLRAMRGNLLNRTDYVALSRLSSVGGVGASLREYAGYAEPLELISGAELRRTPLERRLIYSVIDDYFSLYKFITDYKIRGFMENFFIKYEIRIIQSLLGYIFDEREKDFDAEELSRETKLSLGVKLSQLLKAKTVPELISGLAGTAYYPVLARVYHRDVSLFTLDTQLDLYYYRNLWSAVNKFPDKIEKKALRHIAGTELDLKNLMWAYRFKRYSLETPQVYACLVPAGYRIRMPELKRIVESDTETPARNYKNVFDNQTATENSYLSKMAETMNRLLRDESVYTARIFAYLFLKEIEVYNLTSLIEGVRYELPPKEILSYLCLPA